MRISDWSSDVCSSDLIDRNRWRIGYAGLSTTADGQGITTDTARNARPRRLGFFLAAKNQLVDTGFSSGISIALGRETKQFFHCIDLEIGSASCRERVCQNV